MRVVSLELAGSHTAKKARQNEAIHLFLLRKRKIHRFIKLTRPRDCTLDSKRRG
jgi:hypothetical protein